MTIQRPIFVVPGKPHSLVCDSADPGHPVSNLGRFDAIGLTWQSGGSGSHFVRGQIDSAEINFCSILEANAVAGTKWRLRLGSSQSEVDGGSAAYDTGAIDFISPTPSPSPKSGLFHSHLEIPAAVEATWFRIDITDHTGVFEASMLVLGKVIRPTRFYNWDFERGVEDLGEGSFTPWGVFDEMPGKVIRTLDFTLGWVSEEEFEDNFAPLIHELGTRGFLYVCFDPEPTPRRQSKTYFGRLKKPGFARGARKPMTFSQDYSIQSTI